VTVIEARGLRKEFTVRVRKGWLRHERRVIAAVDSIDCPSSEVKRSAISAPTAPASRLL
jgi:hypothetical protein